MAVYASSAPALANLQGYTGPYPPDDVAVDAAGGQAMATIPSKNLLEIIKAGGGSVTPIRYL